MKVINMGQSTSVMNQFVAELRDVNVQKDRMRFRRNLERIGEMQAYEISKNLSYAERVVQTPLGKANMELPREQVVVGTVFRAGLPHHQGFLNVFDGADNAFVSAFRYADDLALAMEARCYRGGVGRSRVHELAFRWFDALAVFAGIGFIAALIFGDRYFG